MKHYVVKCGDVLLMELQRESEITLEEINECYIFDDYPSEDISLEFLGEY